jgi:hypothetical protein
MRPSKEDRSLEYTIGDCLLLEDAFKDIFTENGELSQDFLNEMREIREVQSKREGGSTYR